jgi:indole-3-glycerol phosphate synthase
MNILDKIIEFKRSEIEKRRSAVNIAELEKTFYFNRERLSLKRSLQDGNKTGIIAEFKRRSPSKGVINDKVSVMDVTKSYTENGASGLSILTDENFFGGSNEDLVKARINEIPILRKDFIIDEYQLIESKAIGADVILLIAACLTKSQVKQLAGIAKGLGLEVLLELHDENELEHICDEVDLVGINNRDLRTFVVDTERSLRMAEKIPAGKIKIAESGINSVDDILLFRQNGFEGFLIGELFMKEEDPGVAFAEFINALQLIPPHAEGF